MNLSNHSEFLLIFCRVKYATISLFPTRILPYTGMHAFFMSTVFISNPKLKLAKNLANAEQHPEAELLV